MDGQPYGLAVADGRLYISTDQGFIYCFGSDAVKRPAVLQAKIDDSPYGKNKVFAEAAEAILKRTGISEGYCLDLGCGDGSLAYELAKRTNLNIYAIDSDPKNVALARQRLDSAGLYGVRVTVHQGDPARTDYPDYFADLIVSGRSVTSGKEAVSHEEMARIQRPYGGIACVGKPGDLEMSRRGALEGAASWTHQYADPANTCCTTDEIAEGPLGMLWFRDADQLVPNRHGRGHAPLYLNGRIFIMGVNSLRATDAYNGRTLWEYSLPGIQMPYHQEHLMGTSGTGSNFCVTEDGVYVRLENRCLCFDPATGTILREFNAPTCADGSVGTWGYIACTGDTLFGSLSNVEHVVGYRFGKSDMNGMPTESSALFALDAHTGKKKWTYRAQNSIRHNSIAVGDGIIYFIDRPIALFDRFNRGEEPKEMAQASGELLGLDTQTGEIVWRRNEGIYGTLLAVSTKHDILLMAYQATRFRLPSEVGGRMTAFRASTGEPIWDIKADYESRPLINDDVIYVQPGAWSLLTGEPTGFQFTRSYGCGIISGSKKLMVFRSATIGYIDLQKSNETQNYGGTRPGCWINALPAGGLVLMPNGFTTCTCSYLIRANLALQTQ
ncbi:MAG: PQQ-binding-like beta-propeller repeat protein [bacterium]